LRKLLLRRSFREDLFHQRKQDGRECIRLRRVLRAEGGKGRVVVFEFGFDGSSYKIRKMNQLSTRVVIQSSPTGGRTSFPASRLSSGG
jgi:hypothetical protein